MAQSWAPCAKLASLTEKSLRQEIIVSYARKVITTQFFEGMKAIHDWLEEVPVLSNEAHYVLPGY